VGADHPGGRGRGGRHRLPVGPLPHPGPPSRPGPCPGSQRGELLGRASAPVLVEEYGDFQCPVCGQWERTVYPTVRQLVDQGRIRFEYHPIAFIGPESTAAANAAEAAGDEGRFWANHDLLFADQAPENSGVLTTDRLLELGVNQTPTVLVDGQQVDAALTAQGLLAAVNAAANASGS
jgi:protein-disulfide isomerase